MCKRGFRGEYFVLAAGLPTLGKLEEAWAGRTLGTAAFERLYECMCVGGEVGRGREEGCMFGKI